MAHWDHDCESCRLIGMLSLPAQDGSSTLDLFDIYVCPQGGHPTIVARYGDEGPEYISGNRCPLPGLELRLDGDSLLTR